MGRVLACAMVGALFLLALLVSRYLPQGDDQVAKWLRRGASRGSGSVLFLCRLGLAWAAGIN